MKKAAVLGFILLLNVTCFSLYASADPFVINNRLGRGINIGNTFEAPSEQAWGNPWDPEYCRIIADLGFSHIRVPIRWEPAGRSMPEYPYTINPDFLVRIKSVIDTALSLGLHVVINMHHHDLLIEDPGGQKDRFLSQWEQIAGYFSDYPDSLLFEVLNEPHSNLTPQLWNQFFSDALEVIRNTNPHRVVMMGTAEWGGLGGLQYLELPDDPNIIVTVHYYNPFTFTHQNAEWVSGSEAWSGTGWYDTAGEREAIKDDFKIAVRFSHENNVPVHVGEFGAYSAADSKSRARWTTFVSRYIEQVGFSWAYWEFSSGFGIFDPSSGQLRQFLVDALLHNVIGEPVPVERDTLYQSDFSAGTDGWSLNTGGGASAALASTGEQLEVSIASTGSNNWDIQIARTGFTFETAGMYRVSFTASSDGSKPVTAYAGRSVNPWNAYSSYESFIINPEPDSFSFVFRMNYPVDKSARLVFDLGSGNSGFVLHDLVVERLTIVTYSAGSPFPSTSESDALRIFPNPTCDLLFVSNPYNYRVLIIYDTRGSVVYSKQPASAEIVLFLNELAPGIYMVCLSDGGRRSCSRMLKL